MAKALYSNKDIDEWAAVLAAYDSTVATHGPDRLKEHIRWYERDLPAALAARVPPSLTQPELVRIVSWKLARGTWRPKLLDYSKALSEQQVQEASLNAFALLQPAPKEAPSSNGPACSGAACAPAEPSQDRPSRSASKAKGVPLAQQAASTSTAAPTAAGPAAQQPAPPPAAAPSEAAVMAALAALAELKGVGPATASACLSALEPSCPYMGDEALEAALPGKRAYTPAAYRQLLQALRHKAQELNQAAQATGGAGTWNARLVERCLFAAELVQRPRSGVGGGKAKRPAVPSGSEPKAKKGK